MRYYNPDGAKFYSECATPLQAAPVAARKEHKFASALFPDLMGLDDAVKIAVAAGLREEARTFRNLFERQGRMAAGFATVVRRSPRYRSPRVRQIVHAGGLEEGAQ